MCLRWSLFLFTFLLSLAVKAESSFEFGAGFTSITSGRTIPGAALAMHFEGYGLSGFATGVQSKAYYHSGYSLAGYRSVLDEEFIWGKLLAEIGVGAYYAQHGYREQQAGATTKHDDGGGGPAFRVSWAILPFARINAEATLGMINSTFNFILLSFQDVAMVSLTCEL